MAVARCDFYSDVLEMGASMTVVVPENHASRLEPPPPPFGLHRTLYLLHGLSDDDTMFLRRSSIERYASERGLAVVMPQAHRSYYTDEAHGLPYWTFISEELPDIASRLFRLSSRREDTYVAGISMGGYGAFKWALRQPERFAAAASLSGALGLAARLRPEEPVGQLDPRLRDRIFDDRPIEDTVDDPTWLLGEARRRGLDVPALWVSCGTEDALFAENDRFRREAEAQGIPLTVRFGPGAHTWDYWDRELEQVLDWLPPPAAVASGGPNAASDGRLR